MNIPFDCRMNAHESDSDSEEEPEKPAISEDPKDNSDEEREAKRLARVPKKQTLGRGGEGL